jgi:hypothetical protein
MYPRPPPSEWFSGRTVSLTSDTAEMRCFSLTTAICGRLNAGVEGMGYVGKLAKMVCAGIGAKRRRCCRLGVACGAGSLRDCSSTATGRRAHDDAGAARTHAIDRLSAPLAALLAMRPDELATCDIGRVNLACALGLPGSEDLDIDKCVATLDRWAAYIASETRRGIHRFRANPGEFHNSETDFRTLMMNTVLQQDFGVRYNPERIRTPDSGNSKDNFIHGMIDSTNGGTCASMPVLAVAVGRRLGYPLYLVNAKGHLFCRWDDGSQRFNIEVSGEGLNNYDDEYYPSPRQSWRPGSFSRTKRAYRSSRASSRYAAIASRT